MQDIRIQQQEETKTGTKTSSEWKGWKTQLTAIKDFQEGEEIVIYLLLQKLLEEDCIFLDLL